MENYYLELVPIYLLISLLKTLSLSLSLACSSRLQRRNRTFGVFHFSARSLFCSAPAVIFSVTGFLDSEAQKIPSHSTILPVPSTPKS